jgi:hypothetical protein
VFNVEWSDDCKQSSQKVMNSDQALALHVTRCSISNQTPSATTIHDPSNLGKSAHTHASYTQDVRRRIQLHMKKQSFGTKVKKSQTCEIGASLGASPPSILNR